MFLLAFYNFPRLLDFIKKNAPRDCDVVIVGAINPLFNITISEDALIPVGNMMALLTDSMNKRYEQLAELYGFKYADMSNVETGSTAENVWLQKFISSTENSRQTYYTHPTYDGFTQMADLIIDELACEKDYFLRTTVVLDTGRIDEENISSVKVNGVERYFYTKDGKLYVPCLTKFADKLTVTAEKSGKTQLSVYKLDYDSGYEAKRIYTTNDLDAVKSSVKGLFDTVKGYIFNN